MMVAFVDNNNRSKDGDSNRILTEQACKSLVRDLANDEEQAKLCAEQIPLSSHQQRLRISPLLVFLCGLAMSSDVDTTTTTPNGDSTNDNTTGNGSEEAAAVAALTSMDFLEPQIQLFQELQDILNIQESKKEMSKKKPATLHSYTLTPMLIPSKDAQGVIQELVVDRQAQIVAQKVVDNLISRLEQEERANQAAQELLQQQEDENKKNVTKSKTKKASEKKNQQLLRHFWKESKIKNKRISSRHARPRDDENHRPENVVGDEDSQVTMLHQNKKMMTLDDLIRHPLDIQPQLLFSSVNSNDGEWTKVVTKKQFLSRDKKTTLQPPSPRRESLSNDRKSNNLHPPSPRRESSSNDKMSNRQSPSPRRAASSTEKTNNRQSPSPRREAPSLSEKTSNLQLPSPRRESSSAQNSIRSSSPRRQSKDPSLTPTLVNPASVHRRPSGSNSSTPRRRSPSPLQLFVDAVVPTHIRNKKQQQQQQSGTMKATLRESRGSHHQEDAMHDLSSSSHNKRGEKSDVIQTSRERLRNRGEMLNDLSSSSHKREKKAPSDAAHFKYKKPQQEQPTSSNSAGTNITLANRELSSRSSRQGDLMNDLSSSSHKHGKKSGDKKEEDPLDGYLSSSHKRGKKSSAKKDKDALEEESVMLQGLELTSTSDEESFSEVAADTIKSGTFSPRPLAREVGMHDLSSSSHKRGKKSGVKKEKDPLGGSHKRGKKSNAITDTDPLEDSLKLQRLDLTSTSDEQSLSTPPPEAAANPVSPAAIDNDDRALNSNAKNDDKRTLEDSLHQLSRWELSPPQPQSFPPPPSQIGNDQLWNRIQELESQLQTSNQSLQTERRMSEERLQAVQLRLYIAETKLKHYQDALQTHIESVQTNVAVGDNHYYEQQQQQQQRSSTPLYSPTRRRR